MRRREFIISAAAISVLPGAVLAAADIGYEPGLVKERLAAGETVFLDVATDWCTTCQSQGRTISAFRKENPAYDAAITFVRMDWDVHAKSALAKELRIPRRSTLIVLKGDEELGRIVAQTSKTKIKELLDVALGAATA